MPLINKFSLCKPNNVLFSLDILFFLRQNMQYLSYIAKEPALLISHYHDFFKLFSSDTISAC